MLLPQWLKTESIIFHKAIVKFVMRWSDNSVIKMHYQYCDIVSGGDVVEAQGDEMTRYADCIVTAV